LNNVSADASDRERILQGLRSQRLPPQPLPTEQVNAIRYTDPLQQFTLMLESVGGMAQRVADATALGRAIAQSAAYREAARRCTMVALPSPPDAPQALEWNVSLNDTDDPHDLASLDFAVHPGHFGVAENGAVWVTDHRLKHRAAYFIARHLALVIPSERVVHTLHEAYERISFADGAFGCFISGPSKTADIEQALVIGAHGPRSLTVYLVDDAASCGWGR
jgi:L-lactate dehydrogenase complex protein LldG